LWFNDLFWKTASPPFPSARPLRQIFLIWGPGFFHGCPSLFLWTEFSFGLRAKLFFSHFLPQVCTPFPFFVQVCFFIRYPPNMLRFRQTRLRSSILMSDRLFHCPPTGCAPVRPACAAYFLASLFPRPFPDSNLSNRISQDQNHII